jgi:hypothetical protein
VFGLLAERVSAGENHDVRNILPRPIRAWWLELARGGRLGEDAAGSI